MIFKKEISGLSIAALVGLLPVPSQAAIMFDVTIVDVGGDFLSLHDSIRTHTLSAAADWAQHFIGMGNPAISINVDLDNPDGPRATGRSAVSSFLQFRNGFNIVEEGAVAEIRTGVDPNGTEPDVLLTFETPYLTNELWFDPDPVARSAIVPANRTDAASVFLHELGHAFGFNGFINDTDGTFPSTFKSTFDELIAFDGMDFSFVGPNAAALYGGPVPLTFGNVGHLGNRTGPGVDLIPDLMNGVVFDRGTRYDISTLDLAILSDIGMPIAAQVAQVPEPGTSTLFLIGLVGLVIAGSWRQRGRLRRIT